MPSEWWEPGPAEYVPGSLTIPTLFMFAVLVAATLLLAHLGLDTPPTSGFNASARQLGSQVGGELLRVLLAIFVFVGWPAWLILAFIAALPEREQ